MTQPIPSNHPIRQLFTSLTERSFLEGLGIGDFGMIRYVSNLLVDFINVDHLYRIRNARGKPLDDVGKMLLESDSRSRSSSAKREQEIRKHIGDYTLFFTGMFPESLKRRVGSLRLDYFVDYIRVGKESYLLVARIDPDVAPLFKRLSDNFDYCVVALNYVKKELERMRDPNFQRLKKIIIH
jgi:hypothetical protein